MIVALKFIADWFDTCKMILKSFIALFGDDGLLFFGEDYGNVTCCCIEMGVLSVNLKNIYLDNNFDKDNPDTIILVRLLVGHSKVKNAKYLKKEK